jgi:transposase
MRKQFDGLIALVRSVLSEDPLSGHLFAFCNRRRDRIKLLFFDRNGFWVLAKRLERGTFAWPSDESGRITWSAADLSLLLSGVDPATVRRRRWWTHDAIAAK